MSAPRLTIRARLMLLYTGLFAVCGSIVIVITYLLVAAVPIADADSIHVDNAASFLEVCRATLGENIPDPRTLQKCQVAFTEGVVMGRQDQRETTLSSLLQYSILTLVVVTALAALIGWIVATRAVRPVHRIASAARAASRHDLSARVALTGPRDELRDLADTFDDMLTRLQAAFDSQRRFIANASHELRTPLAVVGTSVDVVLAKTAPTRAELIDMGHEVRAAAAHAERLIDALLTLARNENGLMTRAVVDFDAVAENAVESVDPRDRRLATALQPATVVGDPVLLERLVANLVDNAVRYNDPGGSVWISSSSVDDTVRLTVANTGPRVPPEAVDGLFEPFRRLHERSGTGYGLGLALVRSIATIHNGSVRATAREEGGLSVTVTLPRGSEGS
ncbi:sensor histidine kinase [Hamadaea tsunoensis]|uniref:sensor histidine kinase n=1 Tax=Hamadaea tsunoensis TaxID=53368 RepID=UPI000413A4C6|nr:HAMP domain-containing sensor histidine kinase [Hamadaea tsunoensis]